MRNSNLLLHDGMKVFLKWVGACCNILLIEYLEYYFTICGHSHCCLTDQSDQKMNLIHKKLCHRHLHSNCKNFSKKIFRLLSICSCFLWRQNLWNGQFFCCHYRIFHGNELLGLKHNQVHHCLILRCIWPRYRPGRHRKFGTLDWSFLFPRLYNVNWMTSWKLLPWKPPWNR